MPNPVEGLIEVYEDMVEFLLMMKIFLTQVSRVKGLLCGAYSCSEACQHWPIGPGHYAKGAGGRLHLNMHTSLTQRSRSGLTMRLSRHSVGTYQETSSHAIRQGTLGHSVAKPLWTDPGLESGISVRQLTSTLKKKKKKTQAGNELSNIIPKSWHARKKLPLPPVLH